MENNDFKVANIDLAEWEIKKYQWQKRNAWSYSLKR